MTAATRTYHVVPVALYPAARILAKSVSVIPGVSLRQRAGPIGRLIDSRASKLPVAPGFLATHLIVIDEREYLTHLDSRLRSQGRRRDPHPFSSLDIDGLGRQILMALTLGGRLSWEIGGHHTFEARGQGRAYSGGSYAHRPTIGVSGLLRYSTPHGWATNVPPARLRVTSLRLDPYYRSGVWWVDRLSAALGYLWSSLTTSHPELAFSGMCMALEALVTTGQTEITHTLAERCAILSRTKHVDRVTMYQEVKQLYSLRSKIVHGRSASGKGTITMESLSITAKHSMVPRSMLFRMLSATIDVINSVLSSRGLLTVLQTRRSEGKASEAIDAFFQSMLLR